MRSFFRFFDSFASIVQQQFAVSLYVHNDWLCATTANGSDYDPAADGGFDPEETRFLRKGGGTVVTGGGC